MAKRRTVSNKGVMTIPQLRRAFDHMESYTQQLLRSGASHEEQRKRFQAEWKKTFRRDVQAKAADSYLQFAAKKHKASGTRKQKKQRGGMAPLAGAPLDYVTRPGVYGPYGEFPAYVSSGFAFYNDINKDSQTEECGIKDITPNLSIIERTYPPQKGGKKETRRRRNQRGGFPTVNEFAQALTFRPLLATNPANVAYDAMMTFKGQPPAPVPGPNTGNPPYMPTRPLTFDALATPIQRNLTQAFPSA